MQKFKLFAISGLCVAMSISTFLVARYTADAAMKLEQEGSGGGQPERANIRPPRQKPPPPPEQQQMIDDFAPPPVKMDSDERLVPIDPEQRRKSEKAIQYWEVSNVAFQAVWIIPVVGLFLNLMAHVKSRKAEIETEREKNALASETSAETGSGQGADISVLGSCPGENSPKEGKTDERETDPRCGLGDQPANT